MTFEFSKTRLRFWFPGNGSGVVVWSGIWKESRAQLRIVEKHRELIGCWIEKAVEKI